MPTKLKEDLALAAAKVEKNGKRRAIRRGGRVIAALVPAEDLLELEEMDRLDARAHRAALAQARKRGEKPIPIAHVKKMLGF